MYSIIIPVWNANEYANICVDSIRKNTTDYEIIIVDNASEIPFNNGDVVLTNKVNKGFAKACNQGIKAASGDIIILLNSDTVVTPFWADRLKWHLENGLDLVAPVTNEINGVQRVRVDIYKNVVELNAVSQQHYIINKHRHVKYHKLVGFCLCMKREFINDVGYIPTCYGLGNYEDDEYCLTAIENNKKVGIASDVFIHHYASQSFIANRVDYNALMQKNYIKFLKRWEKKYEELVERSKND